MPKLKRAGRIDGCLNPGSRTSQAADKNLMNTLSSEIEGVLAWMVRGCLEWRQSGLQVPPDVTLATDDYRKESDYLQAFIDEVIVEELGSVLGGFVIGHVE